MEMLPEIRHGLFNKLIGEINRKILDNADIDEILDFIFDSLHKKIPYDRMGIGLLNPDGTMKLAWVKSYLPVKFLRKNYSSSLVGSTLRKVLDSGQPRIISDLREFLKLHPDSKSTDLILKDGILSSLTCPLRSRHKAIGAVFFSSTKENSYNDGQAEAFMSIAEEITVVLEYARLQKHFDGDESRDRSLRHLLHDFRSPLGVMKSYLELANSAEWFSRMGPEAAKVCEVLSRNTSHLMGLLIELSDLRDLAHHPSGIELRPTEIKSLVREATEMGISLTRPKEIHFLVSVAADYPATIAVDKLKILRALENLFSNAVKFSERGTTIQFSVKADGNYILFIVTDQGRGIPAAEKHLLFQEFGKTSTRPTEGESSTGLGLSIVREIAQLHGGRAEVSSAVERGSTFTLRIPSGSVN